MKCEICEKEILRDSQCINYKYYHNDCIENLHQENKQLKEQLRNISNEFLKYNWKTATQEQIYNQLKNLYGSILKGDSNE